LFCIGFFRISIYLRAKYNDYRGIKKHGFLNLISWVFRGRNHRAAFGLHKGHGDMELSFIKKFGKSQ